MSSALLRETLGFLMKSRILSTIERKDSSRGTIPGVTTHTLGGDKIKTNDDVYELNPEIHTDLSSTGITGSNRRLK